MTEEGKRERGMAITCAIIALVILAIVVFLFVCSIVVIFVLALLGPSIGDIFSRITRGLEQPTQILFLRYFLATP
ncbi:MAG: hypothetical protein ACE5LG_10040 [Anaerolineae bacterium]